MRSNQLVLDRYDTDKIAHRYLKWYDPFLQPWVDQEVKVLELGVHRGGSLLLWRDYFPRGTIVGVDLRLPRLPTSERIYLFQGNQADTQFLTAVARQTAPDGFDIIIDDASHIGELTRISFWHLFENHLKPSGLYVIEDWGTGYWGDWPDGKTYRPRPRWGTLWWKTLATFKRLTRSQGPGVPWPSHHYGMVGFVKELIDEQGAADLTRGRLHGKPQRQSKFEQLVVTPSIVFVKKRSG